MDLVAQCAELLAPLVRYDANDYEYGAVRIGEIDATWCWAAGLGRPMGATTGIEAAVDVRDGTTTYRLRIPWTALAPFKPRAHAVLGFSLLINDGDGENRRWCSFGGSFSGPKRPDTFLALRLTD